MSQKNRRRALLSGLIMMMLIILCGVLGALQYRWIGEVSDAARERLRGSMQASLSRFSREFNSELATAAAAIVPSNSPADVAAATAALTQNYAAWKKETRHAGLFAGIGLAVPQNDSVTLQVLDLISGTLRASDWPSAWAAAQSRIEARVGAHRGGGDGFASGDGLVIDVPLFADGSASFGRGGRGRFGPPQDFGPPPGERMGPPEGPERRGPGGPFGRREIGWVILELNLPYVRENLLPELLQRDLADYQVEIRTKTQPPGLIYQSDPGDSRHISASADSSTSIFSPQYASFSGGRGGRGMGPGGPGGPGAAQGRWEIFVRHRAGSLEAVVNRLRWRDLLLTAGILLLMMASVGALIQYTRRAQRLAQVQMDFVAGVSHELRTPLTVIHTAGYNLRGKMANNPTQVERYGALIQQESGRLTDLVEQILRFAGAEAGRVIQEPEPLSVESVIQDTMETSKSVMGGSHDVIEQKIDDGLPLILGDPIALRHALQNLLANAAKYGTRESNWIGIFASKSTEKGRPMVEIRVADRGPGIPEEEQRHIFDPFFRGQQAKDDQVHGTGLGLNLVKKIIEAHGGTIRVKSEPMKGAEFIVKLPEAAAGVTG